MSISVGMTLNAKTSELRRIALAIFFRSFAVRCSINHSEQPTMVNFLLEEIFTADSKSSLILRILNFALSVVYSTSNAC